MVQCVYPARQRTGGIVQNRWENDTSPLLRCSSSWAKIFDAAPIAVASSVELTTGDTMIKSTATLRNRNDYVASGIRDIEQVNLFFATWLHKFGIDRVSSPLQCLEIGRAHV